MSVDFISKLNQLSSRISETKDKILTEEATKMSFIIPFFQILGYDVFNPSEFVPEFVADVGNKKGEKVDYAIIKEGVPTILVEAKWCQDALTNHDDQLYRYFTSTKAKFAILTNGIIYKFFTDLEEPNKMDSKPFLELNLLDLKEAQISELKKFNKDQFDLDKIFSSASELKYLNNIKNLLSEQFSSPSDAFVRFILANVYDGLKTQTIIDKFTPLVKKALNQYLNETINDRLKSVISPEQQEDAQPEQPNLPDDEIYADENKIVTTEEEIQSLYIVKSILAEKTDLGKIVAKDTETYFGILYEGNTRKWICRLKITKAKKILILPDEEKYDTKYVLENLSDIYNYKDSIIKSLERFLV